MLCIYEFLNRQNTYTLNLNRGRATLRHELAGLTGLIQRPHKKTERSSSEWGNRRPIPQTEVMISEATSKIFNQFVVLIKCNMVLAS